jgi:hypothetical protein
VSDCNLINDFIANDLASPGCHGLGFKTCRFGFDSIRAIFHLATSKQKSLGLITVEECNFVEKIELGALEDEFIPRMAATGLYYFEFTTNPVGIIMFYSDGNSMTIQFGARQSESMKGRNESLPSEYVRVLTCVLQNIGTLNTLNMSEINLSAAGMVHICRVVASLDRNITLSLGGWDVSNSEANNAVCDLICRRRSLQYLSLGHAEKKNSSLPIEILVDA